MTNLQLDSCNLDNVGILQSREYFLYFLLYNTSLEESGVDVTIYFSKGKLKSLLSTKLFLITSSLQMQLLQRIKYLYSKERDFVKTYQIEKVVKQINNDLQVHDHKENQNYLKLFHLSRLKYINGVNNDNVNNNIN